MSNSPKSKKLGLKYAKLVYIDEKTGEGLTYPLPIETLIEMSVNLSDDEVTNTVQWIIDRIKNP